MARSVFSYAALVFALGVPLLAFQYPGQYPSGQYPPGQGGPLGGGGISLPSKIHKKKADQKPADQLPTISAEGLTLSNDGKKLLVGTQDGRTLTMTIAPTTKWVKAGNNITPNSIVPRTTVRVQAAEDDEAFLTVVSVELLKDAPAEDNPAGQSTPEGSKPRMATKASDDEEMARPTILKSPEAPGRPVLRRGAPGGQSSDSGDETDSSVDNTPLRRPRSSPASKPGTESAKATAPKDDSIDFTLDADSDARAKKHTSANDQLVDRTRDWAMSFTNGLPNFLCRQNTTRYLERSRSEGFEPVDVVTAKVLYEDGQEKYSEITVGGKRTSKGMMELGGSTSTGEFASVLGGLFAEATRTDFKFYQSTTIAKEPAAIFDFKVALPHSDWTIQVGGQSLRPAFSGSIWIDKATAQVRRIEMQADNIPKDFPDDTVASAVDYEEVPLGTTKFLLPVHAENLSCQRGTTICTKNVIDFRDYHKYSGESTIEFK